MSETLRDRPASTQSPRRRESTLPGASGASRPSIDDGSPADNGPNAPVLIRLPDLTPTASSSSPTTATEESGHESDSASTRKSSSKERRRKRAKREEQQKKKSKWRFGGGPMPVGWVGFGLLIAIAAMLVFRGKTGDEPPNRQWASSPDDLKIQTPANPLATDDSSPQQAAHFSPVPVEGGGAAPTADHQHNSVPSGVEKPGDQRIVAPAQSTPPMYTEGEFEDPWTPAEPAYETADRKAATGGRIDPSGALSPAVNPVPSESGVQFNGVEYERH